MIEPPSEMTFIIVCTPTATIPDNRTQFQAYCRD
jgi:hypothetical protein